MYSYVGKKCLLGTSLVESILPKSIIAHWEWKLAAERGIPRFVDNGRKYVIGHFM